MFGIVDKVTRQCVALVEDPAGYDPALYDTVAGPVGDPTQWRWDVATESWVNAPPSPSGETAAALEADPRWQAIKTATPDQVETWLTNNVTNLASARRVLKILVLAVQKLARTR